MTTMSPFKFLKEQFTSLPQVPKMNLTGRTVLITGVAAGGIGMEAASALLSYNPSKLIIGNRRVSSAEESKVELLQRHPGIKAEVIQCWPVDLCDFDSVRAFAKRANTELERLDVAVMNAGRNPGPAKCLPEITKDAFENTIQTNAISTALLSILLTPIMKKTAALPPLSTPIESYKPHLVVVGSGTHYWSKQEIVEGKNPIHRMGDPVEEVGAQRYYASKLVIQFIMNKVIPLYPELAISVIDPGLCKSNLGRDFKVPGLVKAIINFISKTAEVGSRNILWAAQQNKSIDYVSCLEDIAPSVYMFTTKGLAAGDSIWTEFKEIISEVAPESKALV